MTAPQKTHYADDETLARIAKLERDLIEANERAHDYLESCKAMFNQHCNLIAKRESLEERCVVLNLSARKSAQEAEESKAELREANANWETLLGNMYRRWKALSLSAKQAAEEEAEELKAALRFYADSENYKPRVLEGVDIMIIPVCDDRGEIARQSLKERAT